MDDLKSVKKISPQPWMETEESQKIMRILNDGEGVSALFVGGCVRNTLLDEEITDFDITTILSPEAVIKICGKNGVKTVPTGLEHGTVTAIVNTAHFEITTLRKDIESDGRHAVVARTDSWIEDAQRRDFTINTLLMDLYGNIYDPTGRGVDDLEKRHVRFVGDPAQRIAEDYLRILRFFRFYAYYGQGEPNEKALSACSSASSNITKLSKERITQEFFKILNVPDPSDILKLMFDCNVLKEFCFSSKSLADLHAFCVYQSRYDAPSISSRLLILACFDFGNIQKMEALLLIPKAFKKEMGATAAILEMPDLSGEHAVRVAIYKHGGVFVMQALMIELQQERVQEHFADQAIEIIQSWDVPVFPVSGDNLIKKGFKPGPELGAELKRLEDEWIDGGFTS